MHELYCPNNIESIVQQHWYKKQTFSATEKSNKEKYYCLSMMPYPSGSLHMGHVRNYTIGDVISRYQRMLGKNVLQPIGWDAFGLPAEQAAITNKIEPAIWTYKNIDHMRSQLQSLGFAYDWNREIVTCNPKYYQWEQWFFTVLYKKGLVYKKLALVNWCPYHNTVLANEQVINNCCWRCNTLIEHRKFSQWFIKITNYADQLLHGLDKLKYWPKTVKNMQRNWIGRSEGVNINFKIVNNNNDIIKIYTTQLDVFMGITYLNISIDHPIALKAANTNRKLANFIKKYDDLYFQLNKYNFLSLKKRGIFTNIYAIHPISNKNLPIWITNFVTRMEYNGIGAEIGVPAHNQQDLEFAIYYNLPIIPVIKNKDHTLPVITNKALINIKKGILCNSGEFNGLNTHIASKIIAKVLITHKVAQYQIKYRLQDWGVSRQRYWGVPIPMITFDDSGIICPVPIEQLPVVLPSNVQKNNEIINCLKTNFNWIRNTFKGKLVLRDTDTFDTFMESSWYYARYTCPHYENGMLDSNVANYWLPIDQYIGGVEHAIMHLMYFRFYHKLMRDIGLIKSDEPAIRLLCQGMVLSNAFYYLSEHGQRVWVSLDKIKTLQQNKTGHILKAVDIYGHHLICAGMCKMSKSKNNGVDPNIMIKKYGADSVRFFIMFAAPPEATLEWTMSGLKGAHRFLKRIWRLVYHHIQSGPVNTLCISTLNEYQKKIRFYVHKTIEKVTDDIDRRQTFNTALSEIMTLVNKLNKISPSNTQNRAVLQEALLIVIRLLYPFTPHISFVLWKALLGEHEDIDYAPWPIIDAQALQDRTTLIIIQINGKKRHKIFAPLNSNKDVIYKLAKKEITLHKYLHEKKVHKIIYIPNTIINIIV